jgi:hypothetical protein
MDHELIGSWLQIALTDWPPDHYTLLGLTTGESDTVRIEEQVYQRMEVVRRYQLTHAEPATEAMNRLAQALVCLTDPAAKRAYDASLATPEQVTAPAPQPSAPAAVPMSIAEATDPLAWLFGPWNPAAREFSRPPEMLQTLVDWQAEPPPQRGRSDPGLAEPTNRPSEDETPSEPLDAAGAVAAAPEREAQSIALPTNGAPSSDAARRGLGTKRALYYRIARTRQLLWAWEQTGKYLNPPRRLKRPSEATELIHHMHAIKQLLVTFPPVLGRAGQPGYLVLSLARQEMIVPMLQALLPSQRNVLARDWQAGHDLLLAHRRFLRQELRALRHRNRWQQGLRALASGLAHHPSLVLVFLGLVALNLAIPALREMWLNQLLAFAILFGFRLGWWWLSLRPTRIESPRPPELARKRTKVQTVGRRQINSSGT